MAAGKHVFCEKPLATTLEDARRVLDAASSARTVFQVGHNRRFAPVYKRLKELLQESPPHTAHIKMNRGELLKPEWTGDDSVTGGFLYETPIHMFDMMRFQFGEIAALDARLSGPNDFSMLIEFASGMYATFVTSADAGWFFPYERVEVYGPYSTIETSEIEALSYRLGLDAETITEDFRAIPVATRFGFEEEDRLFVDAVLSGGAPPGYRFRWLSLGGTGVRVLWERGGEARGSDLGFDIARGHEKRGTPWPVPADKSRVFGGASGRDRP